MSLVFIIPMIGLAIDVGFLYAVKSKLQAAVDGAALAAARALTVGATTSSQASSAKTNAVTWFNANFPSGYFGTQGTVMGTSNVTVADDASNAHVQDVTVTATTQVDNFLHEMAGIWGHYSGLDGDGLAPRCGSDAGTRPIVFHPAGQRLFLHDWGGQGVHRPVCRGPRLRWPGNV